MGTQGGDGVDANSLCWIAVVVLELSARRRLSVVRRRVVGR